MDKKINYFLYEELNFNHRKSLFKRSESNMDDYLLKAKDIIREVKDSGDVALHRFSMEFDNVQNKIKSLKVTKNEFKTAFDLIDPEIKNVITFCSDNVSRFHKAQMPKKQWMIEMHPGVFAGEKIEPIESVAMYVPKGKGSFPSVAMMTSIPAIVAGVKNPIILTPPETNGSVDSATLVAASIAGVENVFKVGGAQAVAAAALGTETIPKCLKIVGPGSPWVAAAKILLSNEIDTGTPAGPSEAIILADKTANGKVAALDLLIEAEHGADSSAYLVTDSKEVAIEALNAIPNYWNHMSSERVSYSSAVLSGPRGGILLVKNISEAIDFINEYAPEHLQILSKNPDSYLSKIKNAGEILLGFFSIKYSQLFTGA